MEGIKVVVLGDAGVGKTAIINRKIFRKYSSDNEHTMGANYNSCDVACPKQGIAIKMDVWDTAGSEQFRSINKLFYNGAACAILVYDITDVQSYNSIKNYWLDEIKNNGSEDIGNLYILYI